MKDYSRSFITLKQDSPGYSINEKPCVGKCIIEITKNKKVKISVSVTNVKPEVIYKVYLISADVNSMYTGALPVDLNGKGEAKWEYDTSFLQEGLTADSIDVVAIIVPRGDGFTVALTGYKDNEIIWKNKFKPLDTIVKKVKNANENLVNSVGEYENTKKETLLHENITDDNLNASIMPHEDLTDDKANDKIIEKDNYTIEKNLKQDGSIIDDLNDIINASNNIAAIQDNSININLNDITAVQDNINIGNSNDITVENENSKNINPKNEYESVSQPDIHEIFNEMATNFKNELKSFDSYKLLTDEELSELMSGFDNPKTSFSELNNIFKKNLKILPFTKQSEPIEWVKIGMRELIYLPVNFSIITNDPIITCLYRRYRHFILGKSQDGNDSAYYLGVPSMYNDLYSSKLAQLGFRQFMTCEADEQSEAGYYIMRMKTTSLD